MKRAGWSRRWLAALAVFCIATATASTAQAQKLAGDPGRCGNPDQANRLRQAMDDVYGALYQVKLLQAYVQAVLALSPANMRLAYVGVTASIDLEQDLRRRYPQARGEVGLRELQARRDLLLQAMTDAELGMRTDPARNAYTPLIQKANDDVAQMYSRYSQAMLACGQTPGEVAPITTNIQAQAYTDMPVLTNPPQAGAAPPTASTGNPAGGRIRFKPMSDADAQQMANAIAPTAPLTGATADLSSWRGVYSDDAANRYGLEPGTPGYMGVVGGPAANATGIILDWDDCRVQGSGVVCDFKGELRGSDGGVAVAGRVVASRSGGVITGTYTLNGVKPLWGRTGDIAAGQVMGFTYRPY